MTPTSNPVRKFLFSAWIPPLIWAGLIFFFSSQTRLPGFETSFIDFVFKKSSHMFVYAMLYFLLLRACIKSGYSAKQQLLIPVLLTLIYAISDEFHQHFVPGRYGTIRDVGYDMLGAGIVFLRQYRYI